MLGKDFNYQSPSLNPFSDFVFDWKSEDPDFKILIPIESTPSIGEYNLEG